MVKDRTNKYYTELLELLNVKGSQEVRTTPASFPHLYFLTIGMPTAARTLSNTEDAVSANYQIEVYSNKSKEEAKELAYKVREYMIGQGFRCSYYQPTENAADSNVRRHVARYDKLEA